MNRLYNKAIENMRDTMRKYIRDNQGVALIEFALILPIMLILTYPAVDYARFVLLQQKLVKSSYVVADAVAMSHTVTDTTTCDQYEQDGLVLKEEDLRTLTRNTNTMLRPFTTQSGDGSSIPYSVQISNIRVVNGGFREQWRHTKPLGAIGGGTFTYYTPARAVPGAQTPPGLIIGNSSGTMINGDALIRVTVSARFNPITPNIGFGIPFLTTQNLDFTSYFPTRSGDLRSVAPNNIPNICN